MLSRGIRLTIKVLIIVFRSTSAPYRERGRACTERRVKECSEADVLLSNEIKPASKHLRESYWLWKKYENQRARCKAFRPPPSETLCIERTTMFSRFKKQDILGSLVSFYKKANKNSYSLVQAIPFPTQAKLINSSSRHFYKRPG